MAHETDLPLVGYGQQVLGLTLGMSSCHPAGATKCFAGISDCARGERVGAYVFLFNQEIQIHVENCDGSFAIFPGADLALNAHKFVEILHVA